MKRLLWRGLTLAVTLLGLYPDIAAAQSTGASDTGTLFGWSLSGSVLAVVTPNYIGSKTDRIEPGGSVHFSRSGALPSFGASDDSPSLQLIGNRALSAGLVIGWQSDRNSDGALRGFDKIRLSIQPGLYATWWPVEGLRLRAEVRDGVNHGGGLVGDFGADAVHDGRRWLLSAGPRLHLGNSEFTETYFGVTNVEAAQSPFGIAPFAADDTFTAVGGLASAEYRYTKRMSVLAYADYQRLLGTAANSPIVARLGARDQLTTALGVRYAFGR